MAIAAVIAFVVLMIVAILAAIAIPVFLRQREIGWESQVRAALTNAASAQESYLISNDSYTPNVGDLAAHGLRVPPNVHVDIRSAEGSNTYCIEAIHAELPNEVWSYDSLLGGPRKGPCF